jgi:hypothetical protein
MDNEISSSLAKKIADMQEQILSVYYKKITNVQQQISNAYDKKCRKLQQQVFASYKKRITDVEQRIVTQNIKMNDIQELCDRNRKTMIEVKCSKIAAKRLILFSLVDRVFVATCL